MAWLVVKHGVLKIRITCFTVRLGLLAIIILTIICLTIDKFGSQCCTVKINVSYMLISVYCLS